MYTMIVLQKHNMRNGGVSKDVECWFVVADHDGCVVVGLDKTAGVAS